MSGGGVLMFLRDSFAFGADGADGMQQRRGRGAPKEGGTPADGDGVKDAATADPSPPVQLRAPRHGGWKGFRGGGREAQMLRGEPGYHLGGCSKWYLYGDAAC